MKTSRSWQRWQRSIVPRLFTAIGVLLLLYGNAAALTISESTDFQDTSPGAILGTLAVGDNVVSGHVGVPTNYPTSAPDLFDYFTLLLPAGTTLTQVVIASSNFKNLRLESSSGGFGEYKSRGAASLSGGIDSTFAVGQDGGVTINFGGSLPGPYNFVTGIEFIPTVPPDPALTPDLVNGFSVASGVGFDYTVKYTVDGTPVPEPSTILLLGSGLLGVVGVARRKMKT